MQILRTRAYARAGLIGNPSDGYHGKTISVILKNFFAEVVLYEWPKIEILWSQNDQSKFDSLDELVQDVSLHGYYGGVRLVKATIKRFTEYCRREGIELHDRTFSIRYQSNIPRQVGLAGSSAIIVATLRALMQFYEVTIPQRVQPSLVLSIETNELNIAAGLQDRVIQIYEGAVYMDFAPERSETISELHCGHYEPLDPSELPPLYIAYSENVGEPTEVTHAPLRVRYDQGEEQVVEAMRTFARYTDDFRTAMRKGDRAEMSRLLDANFDLRNSIVAIQPDHLRMIETARSLGASAKFSGSGGAIVGTCSESVPFETFRDAFRKIDCQVFRPTHFSPDSTN